jgi:hypothetical protein
VAPKPLSRRKAARKASVSTVPILLSFSRLLFKRKGRE